MASKIAPPRYCIQHSRFAKQDGWRLRDLSLSLNGNIAVTGWNVYTNRTYIDVFTTIRHSDSGDKTKTIYSKEFEIYVSEIGNHWGRFVSFYPGSDNTILSGLGDKLEVFDLILDRVKKSRKLNVVEHGRISCLSVREAEIFIGFLESNKITVFDVTDLNEMKSIVLQGIQDGYFPYDMTAIADRIFVCVGIGKEKSYHKSLVFEENYGRILSELTKPTDTVKWYVNSIGVNMNTLGIAGVLWRDAYMVKEGTRRQIVFYSLLSENNCSFLDVEVELDVNRIRISDRGDRMITGNIWTGEVKVYNMADLFTYNHFKKKLASTLQTDECMKLANFFNIPKDQADAILKSDRPPENLFLALEEKRILQPYDVESLIKAFDELTINPFCRHVGDIFLKTRSPEFYIELIKKLEEKISMIQMTSEEERMQLKKVSADVTNDASSTASTVQSKSSSGSLLGDEFAKLLVKVSVKLNKSNCIMMATYFNLPESQIDLLQKESETPGIRLFRLLKERNIINMYDVTELQEALSVLHLLEVNETLVIPYQSVIDPLLYQKNKITRK
ncbi:hypothetical protein HOLleu_21620 [Holothuria leucospilota]|uniref:Uncharacterized protein n=1 Tax=Holothuria leucospilota TaxID=206669 RepID=A0A9Q1BXJ2_HOLLE|nr:hypothetical protein HOLleu_21620 [Holothuria leucospilota]